MNEPQSKQKPAPAPSAPTPLEQQVADLQAQVAELKAAKSAPSPTAATPSHLQEVLIAQRQALEIALEDRQTVLRQQQASKEESLAIQRETAKSTRQRTQDAADRMFQGRERWRCEVPKDGAQPVIDIAAGSREEAIGRYQSLCGIRGTAHEVVADVSDGSPIPDVRPRPNRQTEEVVDRAESLMALHG